MNLNLLYLINLKFLNQNDSDVINTEIIDMGISSLYFLMIIILLTLVIAWIIWWTFIVFRTFPDFINDISNRIDEIYGRTGVFIFVLLLAPALLAFIIKIILSNLNTFSDAISYWLSLIDNP